MRIRIRRCLSILRNTSDGNELAMPATQCLGKENSVDCWYTVDAGLLARWDTTWCCLAVPLAMHDAQQLSSSKT